MVMCGGPPRRSRPICAETVSVTSAGRAPRERRICWERVRDVLLHEIKGRGGLEVVRSNTHEAKPDSADATISTKRALSLVECV